MADITITEEQMRTIRRTLSGLRYGAMVAHPPNTVDNADLLIRFLEAFSNVLVDVADKATAQEEELHQLQNDLDAVGRLFARIQPARDV